MLEVVIGFVIAVLIGLSGVGAGTITAPVLMLFLGVEPAVAVGTALIFSMIVKFPAGLSYLLKGQVDKKILALMVAGGVPGVAAGSLLLGDLARSREMSAGIYSVVGIIILFSAIANLYIVLRKSPFRLKGNRWILIPLASLFIGLEVGFSSSGAGALGTLLLFSATCLSTSAVVGTDILFGLIISIVGGGLHLGMGNIETEIISKLAFGGVLGAITGATISTYVPGKPMRVAILIWLLFIGSKLVLKGISL